MTPDPVEPVVADPAPAAVVEPPAPPAPAAPPAGDAPWAKDLATLFPDETVRTQVDTYLRANVQPHVTKLEQEYAPAKQLWQDLQGDDSVDVYVNAARQLYGDDVAELIETQLANHFAEPAPPVADPAAPASALTPEQQDAVNWAHEQKVEALYASELERISAVDPTIVGREALFANLVVGTEGDFDEAQRRWQQQGLANLQPVPAPPAEPAVPAPPTLDGGGAPVLPTQKRYTSFDDATDDMLADVRAAAQAPPAVGQV